MIIVLYYFVIVILAGMGIILMGLFIMGLWLLACLVAVLTVIYRLASGQRGDVVWRELWTPRLTRGAPARPIPQARYSNRR